jgi:diguanylate cyclase
VVAAGCAVAAAVLVAGPAPGALLVVVGALVGERVVAGRRHRREVTAARRLARTDHLTGLGNRRALFDDTGDALASGEPVGLMLVDLDAFKAVNDTHGHVAGDQVLRAAAARLLRAAGPGCLVARLGRDEFAVLTHGHDLRVGPGQTARVRDALAHPIRLGPGDGPGHVTIGASVGSTTTRPGDRTPTDLLRRADAAMYTAKATRRAPTGPPPHGGAGARLVGSAGSFGSRRW